MRKTIISFIISFTCTIAFAQDFSIQIFFCDAIGNRDTLELGYDYMAGDSIDTMFGEVNIKNEPWNKDFEIRVGSSDYDFETKKQIKKDKCNNGYNVNSPSILYVKCQNWPLTIYWDSSLLKNDCNKFSILTDCHSGGWFDTPSTFIAMMASQDSVIVEDELLYHHVSGQDIIRHFFIDIGNFAKYNSIPYLFTNISNTNLERDINIFLNPVNNIISINSSTEKIRNIRIFNINGTLIFESNSDLNSIDFNAVTSGIYIIYIETTLGVYTEKVIKRTNTLQ